jgi:protein-disulfide isomerase
MRVVQGHRKHYCAGALLLGLLATGGLGCRAQAPAPAAPAAGNGLTPAELNHRIEILVRNRFNLPPDVDVALGPRTKSEFTGYQTLTVLLSQGDKHETIPFLISDDNKSLGRMDKYDLTVDPAKAVKVTGRPALGAENAPVTIVSWDDLECPYCSQMHSTIYHDAQVKYPGKLRIVYKDFPLESIHPWALHAAVDANCLAAQNATAYWNYVDYVHVHGSEIAPDRKLETAVPALDKAATDAGTLQKVNLDALKTCMAAQDTKSVEASVSEGLALGVSATPTLYINGLKVDGAVPADELWKVIDRALAESGAPQGK